MEEERGSWDPGHSPAGGRWVGQDGEAPQANFLLQNSFAVKVGLFHTHIWALFLGGRGFF